MKIKCAAILHDGIIYQGENHRDIGLKMIADGVCKSPYPSGLHQGFITECGLYVTRMQALTIAIEAGQVKKESIHSLRLFSEDLIKK
jgi:hypothetical protein